VRSSQAASIGLIVNELVTNCFKYAFPESRRGAVEVDVRTKDDRIIVTVQDDGVGCPAEIKSGLGTRLISLLASQMKGTVTRRPLPGGLRGAGFSRARRLSAAGAEFPRSWLQPKTGSGVDGSELATMTAPSPKMLEELQRYRRLHAEATDPLAVRLLQDIIAELEASLSRAQQEDAGKKSEDG